MTSEEIERQAAADGGPLPDSREETVVLGLPTQKRALYVRLDPEVPDWFKAFGPGYQSRINSVLRAFVRARKEAESAEPKSG